MHDFVGLQDLLGLIVVLTPFLLVALMGVTTLLDRKLSEGMTSKAVYLTTTFGLLAATGIFLIMLTRDTRHVAIIVGDWVHIHNAFPENPYEFEIKFVFDRLSIPFVGLTFVLFGTIGAFATRYMHREPGYNRFFTLYSLFLAGMTTASLAGTIETLFLGWELVGLSSALLVGFFHERPAPVRNALRIWVVYRVSDAALLLAAVFLHHMTASGDLDKLTGYREVAGLEINSWPGGGCSLTSAQVLIVGSLMIIAAAGKSALVPFSGWLPRAMEGPTPSSAVFYGALSVHLGAFLLLRMDPLLDASPTLSYLVLALGLITAILATLAGRVQTDIKSALSYASLIQVGLIVAEIGMGWRYIPLIHIIGHACLRTLQFVRAPSFLRDQHTIENAMGARIPRATGNRLSVLDRWLYRFSLERGYMDAILDRYVVQVVVGLFRSIDRLEHRCIQKLNGTASEFALELDQKTSERVVHSA